MNKQKFLTELRAKLRGLPTDDVEERLGFYCEMIDDRMEEGVTEEQAVEEMGSVDKIASQIISEVPLAKIVREKIKPKRRLKAWEIVLIVVGSPVWLTLAIAVCAVIFSLFAAMCAVIVAMGASFVALGVGSVGGIVYGVVSIAGGDGTTGIVAISIALVCAGLAVFAFFGCVLATKGVLRTGKVVGKVKNRIVSGK